MQELAERIREIANSVEDALDEVRDAKRRLDYDGEGVGRSLKLLGDLASAVESGPIRDAHDLFDKLTDDVSKAESDLPVWSLEGVLSELLSLANAIESADERQEEASDAA